MKITDQMTGHKEVRWTKILTLTNRKTNRVSEEADKKGDANPKEKETEILMMKCRPL